MVNWSILPTIFRTRNLIAEFAEVLRTERQEHGIDPVEVVAPHMRWGVVPM